MTAPALHPRNRLPLTLAIAALLVFGWLWQMTMPLLDERTNALRARVDELNQRRQAAAAEVYQPLIARLQQTVPAPAVIMAALRKSSHTLELADINYTLSQPAIVTIKNTILVSRKLSLSLPATDAGTALALWQELRQALPCELRLFSFNAEGTTARLELELLGMPD